HSRAGVVPYVADIAEHRKSQTDILGQIGYRRLHFERGAPVVGTADVVHRRARGQVARSEPVGSEPAHQPRAAEEVVEHAYLLPAPGSHVARLSAEDCDDVGKDLVVGPGVEGRLDELYVTAQTGEILFELEQQAAGRIARLIERVVDERIARHGNP